MEIPNEIDNKAVALALAIGVILLIFLYRAYVNSRRSLRVLKEQAPHVTRVTFNTTVFALTPGKLSAVLKGVLGSDRSSEIEKFKKDFNSNLWLGILIRNRGLKAASNVSTQVKLATPIRAITGFSGTVYAGLETKEGGLDKEDALIEWNYIEPKSAAVIFLRVQPKDFKARLPYSGEGMRL
jgi:hypothetical protein